MSLEMLKLFTFADFYTCLGIDVSAAHAIMQALRCPPGPLRHGDDAGARASAVAQQPEAPSPTAQGVPASDAAAVATPDANRGLCADAERDAKREIHKWGFFESMSKRARH